MTDDFTELVDGDIPRVDLVGKAANGTRFLIMKGQEKPGLIEAGVIRDLLSTNVSKESAVTDLDASTALVGEDDNIPGSEAWEQVDADTASKWVAILARAKNAIEVLCNRESVEAMAGEECEDTSYGLSIAREAIDIAIGQLAPFAVAEQTESDLASEEEGILAVMKAAVALDEDPFPLTTIEGLGYILKAGRTLSASNEAKIREAAANLQTVLSTLPAPAEGSNMDVTKSDDTTPAVAGTSQAEIDNGEFDPGLNPKISHGEGGADAVNAEGRVVSPADNTVAVPTDVKTLSGLAGSQDDIKGTDAMVGDAVVDQGVVTKAAPQKAVYDSKGNLLGTVDPEKITELVPEDGDGSEDKAEEAPEAPADETPEAAPVAAPEDIEPAPSGEMGTPASDDVAKSEEIDIVKAALTKAEAEHAEVVKGLQDKIAFLEAPARSKVLSNGALPPSHALRGLDKEGTVDVTKGAELREEFETTTDVVKRMEIENEMNEAASALWAQMRVARNA